MVDLRGRPRSSNVEDRRTPTSTPYTLDGNSLLGDMTIKGGEGADTLRGGAADDIVLDTIIQHEGFSPTPYWDVNHWRIGYGSDTWTDASGKVHTVTKNTDAVTREDAFRDLRRRVPEFQRDGIIKYVGQQAWNQLSPETKAAVTSLAYNYGSIEDLPSLKRAIVSAQPEQIAAAIKARGSDNGGINKNRRTREAAMVAPLEPVLPPPPNRSETALGAIQALTGRDFPTATAYAPQGAPLQASPLAAGAVTVGAPPALPAPPPRAGMAIPVPPGSAIDVPSMRAAEVPPGRAMPPPPALPAVEPMIPTQLARDEYVPQGNFVRPEGKAADLPGAPPPLEDSSRIDLAQILDDYAGTYDPLLTRPGEAGSFDPVDDPNRIRLQNRWFAETGAPGNGKFVWEEPKSSPGNWAVITDAPPSDAPPIGRGAQLMQDYGFEERNLTPMGPWASPPLPPDTYLSPGGVPVYRPSIEKTNAPYTGPSLEELAAGDAEIPALPSPPPLPGMPKTGLLPTNFDAKYPFGMPPDTSRLTPGQELSVPPGPPTIPNTGWFAPRAAPPPLPRRRPDVPQAPFPGMPPLEVANENGSVPRQQQSLFDAIAAGIPKLNAQVNDMASRPLRSLLFGYNGGANDSGGSRPSRGNPSVTSITGNQLYYSGDEGMNEVVKLLSGRH